MIIRKIGAVGGLARRKSLSGITSIFKDKNKDKDKDKDNEDDLTPPGAGKEKKKKNDKVAVVIDPRLSKVLRPHQVEGVKVRITPLSTLLNHPILRSSCTNARRG